MLFGGGSAQLSLTESSDILDAGLERAEDARALGVSSGNNVKLTSRRGTLELPVSIKQRGTPPKGSVFVPFFEEAKIVNILTLDAHCPISKQPDYKKCAVRVEKA